MSDDLEKIKSPEGEIYAVSAEATETTNRIMNEGIPFIMIDMKEKKLAIKEGELFLYTNTEGNVTFGNTSGLGFYYQDTRFLSGWEFRINGREPILLSSSAASDYLIHVELTNTDIWQAPDTIIASQETLNVRRRIILKDNLYEQIRIKNYGKKEAILELEFMFNSDFADIFEIRGQKRLKRGKIMQSIFADNTLKLAYMGQDKIFRQTLVKFSAQPKAFKSLIDRNIILFDAVIPAQGRFTLDIKIQPVVGEKKSKIEPFNEVVERLKGDYKDWDECCTSFSSSNELFNNVVERGRLDIRALLSPTERGTIFDAGIPWFTAPFGRDSLIAARECIVLNSGPAKNCLQFLAGLQSDKTDDWRDAEPGKILHEIRRGELANLGEIPHTPYFGSVDSTPLFVILAHEYLKWSGDLEFIEKIKPNVLRALEWVEKWSDLDGDGFTEYDRRSAIGLTNQGWKDSVNSITHKDGEQASSPIALVEVQGYAYHARLAGAEILKSLGDEKKAAKLAENAAKLKELFDKRFWIESDNFFALALDYEKKQVQSAASNPGHCLWSGIINENKAEQVVKRLLEPDIFSGWGIRTLSKTAINYNPMSYHNGSVWPHDNALIAFGMKRYGFVEESLSVIKSLFDVALHQPYNRLPELFCGFTRRGTNWPVDYPVACAPQAWAAGAVFLLIESMLGLQSDAIKNTLTIKNPHLPDWLEDFYVSGLKVGDSFIDIRFHDTRSFEVKKNTGKTTIILEE